MEQKINPFENYQKVVRESANIVRNDKDWLKAEGISEKEFDNAIAQLMEPQLFTEFSIPVKKDDGTIVVYKGFDSQFKTISDESKGGIRFDINVNADEVKALSGWMDEKCPVADIPLSGGKSGVIVDPDKLSENELEQLSRGYVRALFKQLGPGWRVPAPDVHTNGKIMAWMVDEYSKLNGKWTPGTFTGKPLELGGSEGRDTATAQGLVYTVREAAKKLGWDSLDGKTVVVQGWGNAGEHAAKILYKDFGCKLIAANDSKGGACNLDGIDPYKLSEYKKKTRSVKDFDGSKDISTQQLLTMECDILVPAYKENQITEGMPIRTKMIASAANGPTTPGADKELHASGVLVIPDILGNSGGVTVSYFEEVQNASLDQWSREYVAKKLEDKMVTAFNNVYGQSQRYDIDMPMAAHVLATKRRVKALKLRGRC